MTILTQNKEIINYNNIMGIHVVVESEKNAKIKAVGINKYFAILGEYKTKERAEEVLEEIVEQYEHEQDCKCDRSYLETLDNFTYRIPKS